MVCVILVACYLICRARWWRGTLLGPIVLILTLTLLLLGYWMGASLHPLFAFLGRDASLTGRDDLWAAVIRAIGRRPWLGYGFDAVWTRPFSGVAMTIQQQTGWDSPHSHNGFLDLALDLGLVGVGIFLSGLVVHLFKAVTAVRQSREKRALWPLMYLSFLIFYNLTESSLLTVNSLYWVLYVSVAVSLASRPFPVDDRCLHGKGEVSRCPA